MTGQRDEAPIRPSSATEKAEPSPAGAGARPSPPIAAAVRHRFRYTLPGTWVALAFACLAFTPSLLPRSALLQGVVCGISAAIGYGAGVAGAWVWRAFADRDLRPVRPGAWRVFAISAVVLLVAAIVLGQWSQAQLRDLMGAPAPNPLTLVLLPIVAVALFSGLVALSRSLRGLYHRVAGRLRRWMGPRAARALGWVTVVVVTWLVASGLLLNGLAALADRSFSVRNSATAEGVKQPTSPLRSGGPGSLVSWESLGRQGRTITGTGPSAEAIAAFTGSPATEPIRAYAGTVSAEDVEDRAELAVADLERAGGFDRANLLVATTTGSGWLDPGAIDAFEYLTGGDSAVVATQYSFCRRGCRTWSTRRRPAKPAGSCSTPCMTAGPSWPRPSGRGCTCSASAWAPSARDRLQRRVRPAQPDRRGAVRRPAQLQHPLPRVHRPPRSGHPRGRAGLQGWPDRAVHQRRRRRRRAGLDPLGRDTGAVPAAPLGPDRLVEPTPALGPAGLAGRAPRSRRP